MVLSLVFILLAQKSSLSYKIQFKLKIWTLPLTCIYVCEYFIYSVDISDMEYIHSCCRHYQQGSYKLVVISNTVHKYTLYCTYISSFPRYTSITFVYRVFITLLYKFGFFSQVMNVCYRYFPIQFFFFFFFGHRYIFSFVKLHNEATLSLYVYVLVV